MITENSLFNIIPIKEFARQLGKPESTIRTWKRRGDIPAHCFKEVGNTIFVKVKEIQEWLAAWGQHECVSKR